MRARARCSSERDRRLGAAAAAGGGRAAAGRGALPARAPGRQARRLPPRRDRRRRRRARSRSSSTQIWELAGEEFTIGSPQQLEPDPVRVARPEQASGAARPASRPTRACCRRSATSTRSSPKIETLARAVEAQEHLPRLAAGADLRRDGPPAHDLQPDRHDHRPAVEHQPEPPEHPDPHGARAPDPQLLHRRGGLPPDLGRLLAGGAAHPRPRRRRGRAEADLRARRGRARGDRGGGAEARRRRRSARASARAPRRSTSGSSTASARTGCPSSSTIPHEEAAEYIERYLARFPAVREFIERTIAQATADGLRQHAVRPPPADPRAALAQLADPLAGRAAGGQHDHPGDRRGHPQDRDGPLRRRGCATRGLRDAAGADDPRRAAVRGPGRGGRARDARSSRRRWRAPTTSTRRWWSTSASGRTGWRRSEQHASPAGCRGDRRRRAA